MNSEWFHIAIIPYKTVNVPLCPPLLYTILI
nr:MAG TPA: hypothetical protein [Bacteriophage sp.]